MSNKQNHQRLRDAFDEHRKDMKLFIREIEQHWKTWKAAHSRYAPRWLPIDEVVKPKGWVLVLTSYERIAKAKWFSGDGLWGDQDGEGVVGVTHYMPIPDAPEKA